VHHEVHGPQAEVKDAELVNYPSLTRIDNGYPVFSENHLEDSNLTTGLLSFHRVHPPVWSL
jgi:hypothetical protein